jgi:isopentenyl diphosphate isomerase/L-lactate dehydrogenase-like FMN-dependent dehydrogenase
MNQNKYFTISELRSQAKKRIPKLAFDYLDGGAGSEANIHRNRFGFTNILLQPEYLRDVTDRNQKVTVFGHTYDAPIGISPMGLANLIWPNADRILANLAKERNIPYLLSAVGTSSIEEIAEIAPDHAWFQLYIPSEDYVCFDLIKRAKEVGIKVLVLTVDIPEPSIRPRDLRNNFSLPFKVTPKVIMDIARKPRWVIGTLKNGVPQFKTMEPYTRNNTKNKPLNAAQILQVSARLSEDLIKRVRDAWDGTFVIKGILSTKSTEAAIRVGADGIIVSNHGGRQMDSAPSSIEVLPQIVNATKSGLTIMLDSGVRCGTDIVKAFASGASFTFSGRSFMYGLGALNEPGAGFVLDLMVNEVDKTLAQIGCDDILNLNSEYIWHHN